MHTWCVRLLFDDLVFTSYGQMYFQTAPRSIDLDRAFQGQINGLCGAGDPGMLFLVTSTHTGSIPVRVSLWDSEPDLGDWPDIVEASLVPHGDGGLLPWGENPVVEFPLPAESYRVRWNCRGMDVSAAEPHVEFGFPSPDSYELMLWPAPVAPDRIVRQGSTQAAYWHSEGFTKS